MVTVTAASGKQNGWADVCQSRCTNPTPRRKKADIQRLERFADLFLAKACESS
jgi:hypothetical protein